MSSQTLELDPPRHIKTKYSSQVISPTDEKDIASVLFLPKLYTLILYDFEDGGGGGWNVVVNF